MAFCYKCGKQLDEGVNFCKSCGTKQDSRDPSLSHNSSASQNTLNSAIIKSQGKQKSKVMLLAIILGFFGLSGIGHIYAGKINRGIIFLIVGVVISFTGLLTFGISLVVYVGLYIFQIIDANKTAKQLGIT